MAKVLAVGANAARPFSSIQFAARFPARHSALLLALLSALAVSSSRARAETPQGEPPGETSTHFDTKARAGKKDILTTLRADGHFETLLKALQVAGLSTYLKGKAPLTMFAPTDDAFAKLPAGMFDKWLKDPKVLKQVLRYHIIKAYVPSKQMFRLRNALMASGSTARFDVTTGEGGMSTIVINWEIAKVTRWDILASNGVLHATDAVVLPAKPDPEKVNPDKDKDGKKTGKGHAEPEPSEGNES
jgi:uncharacterized surface protein with fasciclin (FAS1) repeats